MVARHVVTATFEHPFVGTSGTTNPGFGPLTDRLLFIRGTFLSDRLAQFFLFIEIVNFGQSQFGHSLLIIYWNF